MALALGLERSTWERNVTIKEVSRRRELEALLNSMAKKEKIEEQEQDEGSDSDEWKPEAGDGEDEEDTESDDVISESDEDDEGSPVRGVVTKGRNKTVGNRKKEEKRKRKGRKNDSVKSKRPRHICPLKSVEQKL
ncbi:uncharacterized protein [Montipora foliosa]|uniref:uncharacterized protein n=1 Tax=Montipora foliosa TaxID=591990 RepID=UPI0035F11718